MLTEQIYYQDVYCTAFTAAVEEIREDEKGVWVRLSRTAFYPEGGGQPCDTGSLEWKLQFAGSCQPEICRARVVDVQEREGAVWHRIEGVRGQRLTGLGCLGDVSGAESRVERETAESAETEALELAEIKTAESAAIETAESAEIKAVEAAAMIGAEVRGEINWQRRLDLMQQHSGEHIVSGLIHARYGYENVGFHLTMDSMTIDLSGELTWEELLEIEAAANRLIRTNCPIEISYPSAEELETLTYRSKKELSGLVRIVTIPGGDICACCGTHVSRTGEIGLVKMISMQKWKNGVRIWLACGQRAEEYCRMAQEQNRQISVALSAKPEETFAAVERVSGELAQLKLQLTGWKYRLYGEIAKQYEGRRGAVLFEDDFSMDDLRHLTDKLMDVCPGECFVFSGKDGEGYRYAIGRRGGDIRGLVKEMNSALSGRGGGKAEMAQGTVQAARAEIENWIRLRENI